MNNVFSIHVPAMDIPIGDGQTFMTVGIGLVAALIARQVIGHTAGFFLDLVLGIMGAFLGRWGLAAVGFTVGSGLVSQLVTALIGAIVLMAVARAFGGRLLPEKK